MFDVLVCGQISIDLIPEIPHIAPEQLTLQGKLLEMGPIKLATGGLVSNTGQALHRLGVDVRLMSLVGSGLFGQFMLNAIKQTDEGLIEHIKTHPDVGTSQTLILTPQNRDRTFLHYAGTNNIFGYESIDFDVVAQSKIFHFGYPPLLPRMYADDGAEMVKIYERVRELGVIAALDMTVPEPSGRSGQVDWVTILQRTLPYVDIFIPSIEEIIFMLRRADYDTWQGDVMPHLTGAYLQKLATDMLDMGVAIAGFKLGEQGFYIQTSTHPETFARLERQFSLGDDWHSTQVYHPAYEVTVSGTTGAGDTAYAGFLAGLVRGLSPVDCVQMACAVGASCVEAADATSGVQNWDATRARFASGKTWRTTLDFGQ